MLGWRAGHLVQGVQHVLALLGARSACRRSRSRRWSPAPPRRRADCRRRCCRARRAARSSRLRARCTAPSGMPAAMPLAVADDVRLDAPVLDGPPFAGAAHAATAPRRRSAGCRAGRTARAGAGRSRAAARCSRPRPGSARPGWPATSSGGTRCLKIDVLDVVDDRLAVVLVAGLRGEQRAIGVGEGDVRHAGHGGEEALAVGRSCWP